MDDSADITNPDLAGATDALNKALGKLEASLEPLVSQFETLKSHAKEAELLSEDRVKLAATLDEVLEARRVREAEFETLSRQTREELDATISALQQALAPQGGSDG